MTPYGDRKLGQQSYITNVAVFNIKQNVHYEASVNLSGILWKNLKFLGRVNLDHWHV